jgi:hypothetical protein
MGTSILKFSVPKKALHRVTKESVNTMWCGGEDSKAAMNIRPCFQELKSNAIHYFIRLLLRTSREGPQIDPILEAKLIPMTMLKAKRADGDEVWKSLASDEKTRLTGTKLYTFSDTASL